MDAPTAWARSRARAAVAVLLALGTLALYSRTLGHGFLLYDDGLYVTENAHVQQGLSWGNVAWAFRSLDAFNWHPLTWLSHMLDVELFGVRPWGHHLVSVLLHAVNAALLWLVLTRATGAAGRALAVAVLFAVHPLHVEPVAWIAERKELLAAFFGLSTLGAYVSYARAPGRRRYAAVVVAFALSLLAKPTWITVPFLLLLLDVWPLHRVRGLVPPDLSSAAEPRAIGALVLEKLPLLALSACASTLVLLAQRAGGATEALHVGAPARLANAVVSYVSYVRLALWPAKLSAFYPYPAQLSPWQIAAASVSLVAASTLALRYVRSLPWLVVGWFWFLGTLVPMIGVVQVGAQGMADRYAYLSSVGLFVIAAWGAELLARGRWSGAALRAGGVLAGAALAVATWRQAGVWSDDVTLFRHAIAVTSDDGIAHLRVSQALAARGELVEALAYGREAVRLQPANARAHKNLGFVCHRLGLEDEAISELRSAIAIEPDYAEAHGNLAIVYGRKGRMREAMEEMRTEMRLRGRSSP